MRSLTPLALTAGTSTPVALYAHEAWAVLYNESNLTLAVTTAMGTRTLPAWTGDLFQLQANGGGGILSVLPTAVLTQNTPPASSLTGDIYYDTERPLGVYPIALARQVSVGNQVSTTPSQSVINDGQAAPTQVVEATPEGASASQLLWDNDGSGTFGGGNIKVSNAGVFTAMPADAIPPAALASGTLDSDVTVPVGNIGSGALPSGVTLPGSQVTGDVAANQIGAGTLDSDVTVPGGNVSGAVATATNVSSVNNATLTQGDCITRADQSLAQMGFGLNGSSQGGFNTYDKNASIEGQNNTQSQNSYFNGTQDSYILSAQALQWQVYSGGVRLRWSTDATPTAGNPVTWSAWVLLYDNNANFKLSVPAAQVGTGYPGADVSGAVAEATLADEVKTYDGSLSTVRDAVHYIGKTDPSGYATINEGDEWSDV